MGKYIAKDSTKDKQNETNTFFIFDSYFTIIFFAP